MICEPSSSSNRPETEYLLTGAKESIVAKINPSDLHFDTPEGIQIKEDLIDNINHETLYDVNADYEESEEIIARTLGNKYIDFLIGTLDTDNLSEPVIPPTILYTENNKIITTKLCGLTMEPIIQNGTIPINNFEFYWNVIIAPKYGVVTYSSRSVIDPHISFSKIGSYTLRMVYKYNRLTLLTSTVFNVLPMDKSQ